MYLLDTDIIIYSLKGNENVMSNLELHMEAQLGITIITLMELYYGAYKSQKPAANIAKIKTLENSLSIISISRESGEIFGMLKADLENNGTPLDDFDIIIAACALTNNMTLVTNNLRHFKRIEGIKLENWAQ